MIEIKKIFVSEKILFPVEHEAITMCIYMFINCAR